MDCVFDDDDRYLKYHNCHRYDQTLLNSLVARSLFGNDNYAFNFNYTDSRVPLDTRDAVGQAFQQRKVHYHEINKMFHVNRTDFVDKSLRMRCY
jgi:hypothetical protein